MNSKTTPQVKARMSKKLKAEFTRAYKKGGFKSEQEILVELITAYKDGRIQYIKGSFEGIR